MNKILNIKETIFTIKNSKYYYNNYIGYIIETEKDIIKIGISDNDQCSEEYGYSVIDTFGSIMTEDNIKNYINSELINIKIVDTALNNRYITNIINYLDDGDVMFIDFETSYGLLQFVVYNKHNGYYGHNSVLISKKLKVEKII